MSSIFNTGSEQDLSVRLVEWPEGLNLAHSVSNGTGRCARRIRGDSGAGLHRAYGRAYRHSLQNVLATPPTESAKSKSGAHQLTGSRPWAPRPAMPLCCFPGADI